MREREGDGMLRKESLEAVFCGICGARIGWADTGSALQCLVCDSCGNERDTCEGCGSEWDEYGKIEHGPECPCV
jgi:hypothetical protein